MRKDTHKFYVPVEEDVAKQETTVRQKISKLALDFPPVHEIDRYIDRYAPSAPSNKEKMHKIINAELLPRELRKAFGSKSDKT